MPSIFDDSARWRGRAQEARIIADQMKNAEPKRTMREIAVHYDVLAERAERRSNSKPKG